MVNNINVCPAGFRVYLCDFHYESLKAWGNDYIKGACEVNPSITYYDIGCCQATWCNLIPTLLVTVHFPEIKEG